MEHIKTIPSSGARTPSVAYLGPVGSFTGQAAQKLFGATSNFIAVPAHDIPRLVRRGAANGGADHGVIPMANIKHGYIENTFSALYDTADVQVIGEVLLPVEFHLLAGPTKEHEIHTVRSHEAALSQCRVSLDRLEAQLGRPINRVPTSSTSAAVQQAAEMPGVAALGSMAAAQQYSVQVLRTGMQDHPENVTHFWALGHRQTGERGTRNKTLFLVELEFSAQNLQRLLQLFAEQGVSLNMLKEHCIPQKSRASAWRRAYFIECDGHVSDPGVNAIYRALRRADWEILRGRRGRLLGSFPAFSAHDLHFQPRTRMLDRGTQSIGH